MIFAVLNSDGQLGFRDSESDSVVQTFAFEGGIIQLRYDLDGNREHRVFVDDAWTPWAKAGVTALQAGDGIDVTGSEDEPVIAVDDSVMRLDRAETITGEKTVTTIKVTNSGSIAPSSDNGSFTVGSSASTRPNVQLSGPNNRGQLRVGTTVAATWTNSGLYAGDSTSQADFLATRGYVDDSAYTPGSGLSVAGGEISVDNTVVRTSRSITAGTGLTGGGNLSADRTLAVDSSVVRTTRSVSAGTGLTGGGDLSADRTLAVDNTVVRTSGEQEIGGAKKLADRTEFGAAITEHVHAVGTGSSINLSLASIFTATLNENRTFSFTGLPAGGTGKSFVLILTHSGAGRSVTWPSSVRWAGGEAPELSDVSDGIDVLTFVTYNGGTTWLGFLGGVGFE